MENNLMDKNILLEAKKVIFTKKNILVKSRNGYITIEYNNIKETSYHKKNLVNYVFINVLDIAPGWLLIKFKEKIGRRSSISFKIKFEDLIKLPDKFLKLLMLDEYIDLSN